MPADPQPDPEFEDGLVRAFDRAAEDVRSVAEPLVTGGLARGRVRRRRRRIAAIAGSVTALAVIGAGGLFTAALGVGHPVPTSHALTAAATSAPPRLDTGVNILLIGLDSRKAMDGSDLPGAFVQDQLHAGSSSDIGGYNTDTLLVLHVPAGGDGKVQAVSIPRDDYVQSAGADGKMHKIEEVYGIAKATAEAKLQGTGLSPAQLEQQTREAGRTATIETVQQFLGVPIDHFAEFNLLGFYDIAQAVGPVQVCVNHATSDRDSGADLRAGLNTLDPSQALAFVRQRHGVADGSDRYRTTRQQAFIASALHTLRQQGVLTDLSRAQQLLDVVRKDLVIDDQWNLLDFMQQVPDLIGGNVEYNTLPISGFATVTGEGRSEDVDTVDPALIRRIVQQRFGDASGVSGTSTASGSAAPDTALPVPGPATVRGDEGIPCVN